MFYYVAEVEDIGSFAKAERFEAKSRNLGHGVNSDGFIIEPIAIKKGSKWADLN